MSVVHAFQSACTLIFAAFARFMNHCLENQDPSVRALIVNHKGVPHVALYANRGIEAGEELLLRYGEVSDSQFFGEECGQD